MLCTKLWNCGQERNKARQKRTKKEGGGEIRKETDRRKAKRKEDSDVRCK